MNSWSQALDGELKKIRGICLDIDDTLSTDGKITSDAFQALWDLKKSGFVLVPITGRPAGWCDHIVRFWPVDAIVGENGAFTFYLSSESEGESGEQSECKVRGRLQTPGSLNAEEAREKLAQLDGKIRHVFPKATWASDQNYRETDLAIDICEDVRPWPDKDVQSLLQLCKDAGAIAKLSSIHVNAWFGDYDKWKGFSHWMDNGLPGVQDSGESSRASLKNLESWIFIGDSPNDEPVFARFPNSVGVANLSPYVDQLQFKPRWLTSGRSGAGFVEMAKRLIALSSAC